MSRISTASSSRRSAADDGTIPPVPERPEEIRSALAALGVRPSKEWGQSFLTDPFVADAEAALVGVKPGQPVVEVGGGLGVLTAALLRRGLGPLTVIERGTQLADCEFAMGQIGLEIVDPAARSRVGDQGFALRNS